MPKPNVKQTESKIRWRRRCSCWRTIQNPIQLKCGKIWYCARRTYRHNNNKYWKHSCNYLLLWLPCGIAGCLSGELCDSGIRWTVRRADNCSHTHTSHAINLFIVSSIFVIIIIICSQCVRDFDGERELIQQMILFYLIGILFSPLAPAKLHTA